ncbi:MAG: DUF4234 domain-containing protein [Eubacterium sp.]|nr:DUF4234 domain-containing protein [Eubacterium sp.]
MFCTNCGKEIPAGTKYCPSCGQEIKGSSAFDNMAENVNRAFDNAEQQLGSAVKDVHDTFSNAGQPYDGQPLKTDRGLLAYIVLNIITCGIYGYYFIYKMAHDINIACDGDGEKTGGLVAFIVLSFLTCGIYSWYWEYKLGNRLAANADRYGMRFQENGTTILLWCLFGVLICGIGPYIAMYILIKNANAICGGYNRAHGLGY